MLQPYCVSVVRIFRAYSFRSATAVGQERKTDSIVYTAWNKSAIGISRGQLPNWVASWSMQNWSEKLSALATG